MKDILNISFNFKDKIDLQKEMYRNNIQLNSRYFSCWSLVNAKLLLQAMSSLLNGQTGI